MYYYIAYCRFCHSLIQIHNPIIIRDGFIKVMGSFPNSRNARQPISGWPSLKNPKHSKPTSFINWKMCPSRQRTTVMQHPLLLLHKNTSPDKDLSKTGTDFPMNQLMHHGSLALKNKMTQSFSFLPV